MSSDASDEKGLKGCVICPSVKRLQIGETFRGGVLMLVRWLVLYPLLYFQYNIKNLQRSPWRMGRLGDRLGSGIIVANHRNGISDLLITQIAAPQWTFFLVDASWARIPFWSWVLRGFRGLPVARSGRGNHTAEERQQFNEKTFTRLAENLVQGGWVSIFPEGVSRFHHQLEPLRPGTAKVALLAEEKAGWDLPLKIFVLGLNYENQFAGRSHMYAQWAEPIDVRAYREAFKQSPEAAEKALLQEIETALKASTLEAPNHRQLEDAHRLAYRRRSMSFHGARRALEDVGHGRGRDEGASGKARSSAGSPLIGHTPYKEESLLYQALGVLVWAILACIGWPFRIFGRLCASDPSEEMFYMQLLWFACLITGGIVGGQNWVWGQLGLTWVACASWLWAWRRGLVPGHVSADRTASVV